MNITKLLLLIYIKEFMLFLLNIKNIYLFIIYLFILKLIKRDTKFFKYKYKILHTENIIVVVLEILLKISNILIISFHSIFQSLFWRCLICRND